MYVCVNLYHSSHLATVMVPMFLCRTWSSNWVQKLPRVISCHLASALLCICSCCSGWLTSTVMAAFKALIVCSTMLRNCLYGGSFLIPPRNAEWKTSPLVCEIASTTVTFLSCWPHTCRYALSPILVCPWLLAFQIF